MAVMSTMVLAVAMLVLTLPSVIISFFRSDRSRWPKFLFFIGVVAPIIGLALNYISFNRANGLRTELGVLHDKQEHSNAARYNALGLSGIAKPPLVKTSH